MDYQRQTRLRSQTSVNELIKLKSSKVIRGLDASEHPLVEDRELPVLRGENKRKRGVRAGRRQKQPFDSRKETSEKRLDHDNASQSNVELKLGEKDGYSSAGEALSSAASPLNRGFSTDFEEPQAMRQQGDKRRESSRLRIKPSKFRESLPTSIPKPKDQKGSDDGSSSLEIVLPMDVQNSSAGQSLTHLDSEIDKPSQTGRRQIKGSQKPSRSNETLGSAHESSSSPRKGFEDNGLRAALAVVKRVMQIKSAEPFNEPVDPVALEIPDYFDVIKEPMDLGTIRENLEAGTKYTYAHEVYEDVQLVWSNCRRYNQEGDPIMDIMKTAETVFNRHWNAAGLQDYMSSTAITRKNIQEDTDEDDSGEEDEMEEDDEDEDPREKSKESKAVAKLKAIKIVHFDTPPSRTKAKRSEAKQKADVELQSESEGKTPIIDKETSSHDSPPPFSNKGRGSPPSSKKRTFGTAHHKPDCICVVCLGRRRKLAKLALEHGYREGEDQQVDENVGSAPAQESKSRWQPKVLVIKLRTSEKTGKKSEISGSAVSAPITSGDLHPGVLDIHKEVSEPERTMVTSTPKVEGAKFYPANHELPLRKVCQAVLQMSHYLFRSTRPSPLGRHNLVSHERGHSATKSRMLEAVESLGWNEKKPGQV